jgi:tetratricopeptide (TPR) repeat protein
MKRTCRTLLIVLLASGLLFIAIPGWAQQPQPKTQKPPAQTVPQEQEEYTEEEYDAYEKATQEADLDKRGTMLLAFMEKFPKSKLLSYIVTAYQTLMFEHQKNQRYAKLLPLAETWLKYYPDDLQTVAYIAESAQMLGQDQKFIDYALKIYAQKPTAKLAGYITQSYDKIGNKEKNLEWTQKLFAYSEFDDNYSIRMIFVKKYTDEKNFTKAAEYAQLALKALEKTKKPESKSDADWQKEKTTVQRVCYYLMGMSHYEKEKYAEAIKNLELALRAERFDAAYYYIGLCNWKMDKVEEAISSFAKAVVLKGDVAADARGHLEKLYKAMHNNTTIGIEKVYRRAEAELAGRSVD